MCVVPWRFGRSRRINVCVLNKLCKIYCFCESWWMTNEAIICSYVPWLVQHLDQINYKMTHITIINSFLFFVLFHQTMIIENAQLCHSNAHAFRIFTAWWGERKMRSLQIRLVCLASIYFTCLPRWWNHETTKLIISANEVEKNNNKKENKTNCPWFRPWDREKCYAQLNLMTKRERVWPALAAWTFPIQLLPMTATAWDRIHHTRVARSISSIQMLGS